MTEIGKSLARMDYKSKYTSFSNLNFCPSSNSPETVNLVKPLLNRALVKNMLLKVALFSVSCKTTALPSTLNRSLFASIVWFLYENDLLIEIDVFFQLIQLNITGDSANAIGIIENLLV